jgi:hypothetical protein
VIKERAISLFKGLQHCNCEDLSTARETEFKTNHDLFHKVKIHAYLYNIHFIGKAASADSTVAVNFPPEFKISIEDYAKKVLMLMKDSILEEDFVPHLHLEGGEICLWFQNFQLSSYLPLWWNCRRRYQIDTSFDTSFRESRDTDRLHKGPSLCGWVT